MIEDLDQYRNRLKGFDWYFAHADDDGEYRRGKREQEALAEARKRLDPSGRIWNEYCPAQFQIRT
jgi:hypothetical protein